MLGMFILWMGWFGFNGGSMLKVASLEDANAVARIFVNTNTAAAALLSRALFGKTDITMVINGALAGLVSITAEPLLPTASLSALIGGVGGIVVVLSVLGLDRLKIDDPVGRSWYLPATSWQRKRRGPEGTIQGVAWWAIPAVDISYGTRCQPSV